LKPLRRRVLTLIEQAKGVNEICDSLSISEASYYKIKKGLVDDGLLKERIIEDILDLTFHELEVAVIENMKTHSFEEVEWKDGSLLFKFHAREKKEWDYESYLVTVTISIDDLEGVQVDDLIKILKKEYKSAPRVPFRTTSESFKSTNDSLRYIGKQSLQYYFEGYPLSHIPEFIKYNKKGTMRFLRLYKVNIPYEMNRHVENNIILSNKYGKR
jgi:hypothetical protein